MRPNQSGGHTGPVCAGRPRLDQPVQTQARARACAHTDAEVGLLPDAEHSFNNWDAGRHPDAGPRTPSTWHTWRERRKNQLEGLFMESEAAK